MAYFRYLIIMLTALTLLFLIVLYFAKMKPWQDNGEYAKRYFADQFQIKRLIGSKKRNDFRKTFDCTYAIIEYSQQDAERLSNISSLLEVISKSDVGKIRKSAPRIIEWLPTPAFNEVGVFCHPETTNICNSSNLSEEDIQIIVEAITTKDSWYQKSNEYFNFFIPNKNIIGFTRCDD